MYLNDGHARNGKYALHANDCDFVDIEYREYDLICPQIPGKKPNAYRASCVDRLRDDPPAECRRCEVGKEIASAEGIVITEPKPEVRRCACGNELRPRTTVCFECKKKTKLKHREKFNELRRKRAEKKKRQKLLAEKKKIEEALNILENLR